MDGERVQAQLKRILSSPAFADAERGSRFLRFVVESTLEGRSSEIKESVIGVEVLGRSTSFDPKTDPIVRVEAGRLRSRLNTYYQNEGKADPVLISLPKGGYVPEFAENKLGDTSSEGHSSGRVSNGWSTDGFCSFSAFPVLFSKRVGTNGCAAAFHTSAGRRGD